MNIREFFQAAIVLEFALILYLLTLWMGAS